MASSWMFFYLIVLSRGHLRETANPTRTDVVSPSANAALKISNSHGEVHHGMDELAIDLKSAAIATMCMGSSTSAKQGATRLKPDAKVWSAHMSLAEMCKTSLCSALTHLGGVKIDILALVDNETAADVISFYNQYGVKLLYGDEKLVEENKVLKVRPKLHGWFKMFLWKETKYDRLFFFDPDVWFLSSPITYFQKYDVSSAAANALAVRVDPSFNNGIMMLKPNASMFDLIMQEFNKLDTSENSTADLDDQTFLASLWKKDGFFTHVIMDKCDNYKTFSANMKDCPNRPILHYLPESNFSKGFLSGLRERVSRTSCYR